MRIDDAPYILLGEIMHSRISPKKNFFKYKSLYISLPTALAHQLKRLFFSFNRFNLYSLYDADYGKNDQDLSNWVKTLFQDHQIDTVDSLVLITHPKVLHYAFNPVSFWLGFDKQHRLIAVLSEVNNTFSQKHYYLCYHADLRPIKSSDWLEAQKEFLVSPFMQIEGKYRFRFVIKEKNIQFFINYLVEDKIKLQTYLRCHQKAFTNWNLLKYALIYPFVTLKTTILIHYQAIKLWLKGLEFTTNPKPLNKNITTSEDKNNPNQ